jgi:hypothetical protein
VPCLPASSTQRCFHLWKVKCEPALLLLLGQYGLALFLCWHPHDQQLWRHGAFHDVRVFVHRVSQAVGTAILVVWWSSIFPTSNGFVDLPLPVSSRAHTSPLLSLLCRSSSLLLVYCLDYEITPRGQLHRLVTGKY